MADNCVELVDRVLGSRGKAKASMEHEVEVRIVTGDPSVEGVFRQGS